ncbi:hypothetical protein JOE11_001609 [Robbsia andropogonis]
MHYTGTETSFTDADRQVLEDLRFRLGLPDIEQTAQWLVKRRLRHFATRTSDRTRRLNLVPRKQICES